MDNCEQKNKSTPEHQKDDRKVVQDGQSVLKNKYVKPELKKWGEVIDPTITAGSGCFTIS